MHKSVINPKTKKSEKKTEWKTKGEERDLLVKRFGKKRFKEMCELDERYASLEPLQFPPGFSWICNHFFRIWRHCEYDINGNRIFTPRTIIEYCECFGVNLNYHERLFVMQMKEWAIEAVAKVKSEHENE